MPIRSTLKPALRVWARMIRLRLSETLNSVFGRSKMLALEPSPVSPVKLRGGTPGWRDSKP